MWQFLAVTVSGAKFGKKDWRSDWRNLVENSERLVSDSKGMASIAHSSVAFSGTSASDLLRSSSNSVNGVPLRTLGRACFSTRRGNISVTAKIKKVKKHDYPWPENPDPNVKGGILFHLSSFKPLEEKQKPVTLDFEKPLLELEKKIVDVKPSLLLFGWLIYFRICNLLI